MKEICFRSFLLIMREIFLYVDMDVKEQEVCQKCKLRVVKDMDIPAMQDERLRKTGGFRLRPLEDRREHHHVFRGEGTLQFLVYDSLCSGVDVAVKAWSRAFGATALLVKNWQQQDIHSCGYYRFQNLPASNLKHCKLCTSGSVKVAIRRPRPKSL